MVTSIAALHAKNIGDVFLVFRIAFPALLFVILLSFCENNWGGINRTSVAGATTTTWLGKLVLEDPAYGRHWISGCVIIAPILKGKNPIEQRNKIKKSSYTLNFDLKKFSF